MIIKIFKPALVFCSAFIFYGCVATQESDRDRLDTIVTDLFNLDLAPGMAVAVVRGNEIIYEKGFGLADVEEGREVTADTQFYIASTTKSFTALAVAMLDDKGEMMLDDPMSAYIPEASFTPPLSADDITIRQLLTMTHGISQDPDPIVMRTAFTGDFTNDQLINFFDFYQPAENSRDFAYGNLGYNLVSLAMDESQRQNWKEIINDEVFAPLGMTSSTAFVSRVDYERLAMPYSAEPEGFTRVRYGKEDSNMHAAGGHLTTSNDLVRYLLVQINEGVVAGEQVFPSSVIAQTHEVQTSQNRSYGPFQRHGWGLGWDIGTYNNEIIVHRFGGFGGFHSHLSFMPGHDIGVVVLVNESSLGSMLANSVSTAIYDELLQKPDLVTNARIKLEELTQQITTRKQAIRADRDRRLGRDQTYPYPIESYAGIYENELLGGMEWIIDEQGLYVKFGVAESKVEVFNSENNQLRVSLAGGGSVVSFNFEDGEANSFTFLGFVFDRME